MIARLVDGGIEIPDEQLKAVVRESMVVPKKAPPAHYDLKACAALKGVVHATMEKDPLQQPQIGYTRCKWGVKKYFPHASVMRWLTVFEADLPGYIEELLTCGDNDLANGVQAHVIRVRMAGRMKESLWREIKPLLSIQGVA